MIEPADKNLRNDQSASMHQTAPAINDQSDSTAVVTAIGDAGSTPVNPIKTFVKSSTNPVPSSKRMSVAEAHFTPNSKNDQAK